MSFFQNPFPQDFLGNWVLGDISQSLVFECPGHRGRSESQVMSEADGPFNLSGNDIDGNATANLRIYYAIQPELNRWALLSVDVTTTAVSTSAVTHKEIADALNNDTAFANLFVASLNSPSGRVTIRCKKDTTQFRYYIVNGRAEEKLLFNYRAGVAELPTYFDRHKVVHLFSNLATLKSFPDRQNILIPLVPGSFNVDVAIINNARDAKGNLIGYSSSTIKADWEMLSGRSGIFNFQKITVDGSDRITQIIEYSAGCTAGDLARKINYTYTATNLKPSQITEIPYTLAPGDLVTP